MKIGLVTICDPVPNFGNKLQNYAGVTVLKSLGAEVHTLVPQPQRDISGLYLRRTVNRLAFCKLSNRQKEWIRYCRFYEFDKKYLNFSTELLEGQNPQENYDYFVVGSDQVWNPIWYTELKKEAFLLTFAKPEQKVCLSPSFGSSALQEGWKEHFAKWLPTFPRISVREEAGAQIVKELTGQTAQVLIDPTLMLTVSQWRSIQHRSNARKKGRPYLLKYFIGGQTDAARQEIQSIAREHNLEICELLCEDQPKPYETGPREFLDLLDHADLICTDSFHGIVFSLLFDKPFVVYDRDGNGGGMESRIITLLSTFQLQDRMPGCVPKEKLFEHSYEKAYEILKDKRREAWQFLKQSLHLEEPSPESPGPEPEEPSVYACYNRDTEERKNSSSGGIYSLLAKKVLEQQGVVFAACYDENLNVVHRKISSLEELPQSRGSKYLQSHLGDTFAQVKEALEQGIQTLFVGTPCQCEGLLSFLGKSYPNLLCVDLICHGVPSKKAWQGYLASMKACGKEIAAVNMRDKTTGWSGYLYDWKLVDPQGNVSIQPQQENPYMNGFVQNLYLRPSCHRCSVESVRRKTDMTLGDYWGVWDLQPEMDDNQGTSVVFLHSQKGWEAFSRISDQIEFKRADLESVIQKNPSYRESSIPHPLREKFFRQLSDGEDFLTIAAGCLESSENTSDRGTAN